MSLDIFVSTLTEFVSTLTEFVSTLTEFVSTLTEFVSTLTEDEDALFDRTIVEHAFKAIAVDQLGGYWNLRMPNGEMTSATISIADQPRISHFCANRPPGYVFFPEFWNAMFDVLHRTRTVLFGPPVGPSLIAALLTRR